MSSSSSSSEDNSTSGDERGVRGTCVMKKVRIARQTHQKISVEWNNNGAPMGDNGSKLQSYIGCTARERIPISFRSWAEVPRDKKNIIWKEVSGAFDIPKDKKRWMLSSASAKWRGFKSNLKHHMYNDDGTVKEHPPKTYRFIEERDWKAYVEYRLSKKFQEQSEYHRQLALQNKYAYRGSRKGYAKHEEELREELDLAPDEPVPRAELWKKCRKRKDGGYTDDVREVVQKMDTITDQASSSEVVLSGRNDLLAQALGKREHPGRVRGVGQAVTITQYFGAARGIPSSCSTKTLCSDHSEMRAEIAELRSMVDKLLAEKGEKMNPVSTPPADPEPLPPSAKGSCSEFFTPAPQEVSDKCKLYWPNLTNEVALGTMLRSPPGEQVMLHNRPLEIGYLRVIVDTPIQPQTSLPRPTEEVATVGDAIGVPIAWPEHLVSTNMSGTSTARRQKTYQTKSSAAKSSSQNMVKKKTNPPRLVFSKLKSFHWIVRGMSLSDIITIHMPKNICHNEIDMLLGKEQLTAWMAKGEAEALHVSVYMRYLFETHCQRDMFGFVCSHKIAVQNMDLVEHRAQYLCDAMIADGSKLYLAPYNAGSHWILIAIHPKESNVFWIDPLHGEIRNDAHFLVNTALHVFYSQGGGHKSRKSPRWITIKCPRQPSNSLECGYYSLRYMREILTRRSQHIPTDFFGISMDPYSKEEIDEVREEWLGFVESYIPSN